MLKVLNLVTIYCTTSCPAQIPSELCGTARYLYKIIVLDFVFSSGYILINDNQRKVTVGMVNDIPNM